MGDQRWRATRERHDAPGAYANSPATAGVRSRRWATGSSPRSTARLAPSAARRPSSTALRDLGIEVRAGLHTGEIETRRRRRGRHRRRDRRAGRRARRPVRGARLSDNQGSHRRLRSRLLRPRRARTQGRPRPVAPLPSRRLDPHRRGMLCSGRAIRAGPRAVALGRVDGAVGLGPRRWIWISGSGYPGASRSGQSFRGLGRQPRARSPLLQPGGSSRSREDLAAQDDHHRLPQAGVATQRPLPASWTCLAQSSPSRLTGNERFGYNPAATARSWPPRCDEPTATFSRAPPQKGWPAS